MTITDHRLAVEVDGVPHMFEPDVQVWDDTWIWTHEDCLGVDYMLANVGRFWSWTVTVKGGEGRESVTLRKQPDSAPIISAETAFTEARKAAREWLALNAW